MNLEAGALDGVILNAIEALGRLAPSGYALALHVRFQTPLYLFQTYPAAWREEYSRDGLVMHDPIVAWGFGGGGVTKWRDLEARDAAGVFLRARAHGMAHGIAFGITRDGDRSFGGFSRPDREFTDAECAEVVALTESLHDLTRSEAPLSPALREDLRALSVGFTHP